MAVDELIDDAPVGQSAQAAVVDIDIGCDFAAGGADFGLLSVVVGGEVGGGLARIVGVYGVKFQPTAAAVVDGLLKEAAPADCPEDEYVVVGLKLEEGVDGQGISSPISG